MTPLTHRPNSSSQAIAEREGRFRALLTATSDIIYAMNADWSVMQALDGRGFLPDTPEPAADWLQKYIYPEDQAAVKAAITAAIQAKRIFELEHRVRRADGSEGWTHSRAVPILNERGEITEWFGVASDITERRHLQEVLHETNEQAQQQKRLYETITGSTPGAT
jgi:two-component system sensor histidine kinase VicK